MSQPNSDYFHGMVCEASPSFQSYFYCYIAAGHRLSEPLFFTYYGFATGISIISPPNSIGLSNMINRDVIGAQPKKGVHLG